MSAQNQIRLTSNGIISDCEIRPSSSKSESNRTLIINALSSNPGEIGNLSDARDTQTMRRLLGSDEETLDVLDAGTTMRFLTAYLAITTGNTRILTGTPRMQERPIGLLVDALNQLGANIAYKNKAGYPPMEISPFGNQKSATIKIPSDVSSQYISALLMIAPRLPQGLSIELIGEVYSRPYIRMTLQLMENFGVNHMWTGNTITIAPQEYQSGSYTIESDWSGASYWYGFMSLSSGGSLKLQGYRDQSHQGDRAIADIMKDLGVQSHFESDGVTLSRGTSNSDLTLDFKNCPDLSMTVIVAAAANRIPLKLTGLESLRIKETDRVAALQNELAKIQVELVEHSKHSWELLPGQFELKPDTEFESYDDHRMAMAFAPLSMIAPIRIENPSVVDKSYPGFWDDVKKIGVEIQ